MEVIKSWNLINTDLEWNYQLSWPEAPQISISCQLQRQRQHTEVGREVGSNLDFPPVGLTASHSLPFLRWQSVLWGSKDSTIKGVDHSACLRLL